MKFFFAATFLLLLDFAFCESTTEETVGGKIQSILSGANTLLTGAATAIDKTLKKSHILSETVFPECIEPPKECPNENITFWYYTKSTATSPKQLLASDPATLDLQSNENPWKVIIHGYTKSKDEIPNPELQSAYFHRGDYNLISVDYAPLARNKCYVQAVSNIPLVANCTAQMIDALVKKGLFEPKDLHVVGFSLGAQTAGRIHDFMKSGKPGRVTGLDPAAPLFDGVINPKLDKNAAEFVDVIHTNFEFNGKLEESGHVDFYVNGGLKQPGCKGDKNTTAASCSHNRSVLYYAESINSNTGFWGLPCSNSLKFFSGACDTDEAELVQMGEDTPPTARGVYYLQTSETKPFSLGKKAKISS